MPTLSHGEVVFWAVLVVAIYKIAALAVGGIFGWMGYRLFLAGIGGPAGDLGAASGAHNLQLTRAAPGTFFALFGALVIAVTIYKGFDVEIPGALRSVTQMLPQTVPGEVPDGGGGGAGG